MGVRQSNADAGVKEKHVDPLAAAERTTLDLAAAHRYREVSDKRIFGLARAIACGAC